MDEPITITPSTSPSSASPADAADAAVGLAWLDAAGRVQRLGGALRRWGVAAEALQAALDEHAAMAAAAPSLRLKRANGEPLLLSLQREPLDGGAQLLLLTRSHSASEQAHIDRVQRRVLRAVALGQPQAEVLALLCREVEALAPELLCSVLGIDTEGRVRSLAGPSLPAAYNAALAGQRIGPAAGSCGSAAWRREPVEVQDIARDPLWADYCTLALAHGLAACWSTPVLLDDATGERRVAATFALYRRTPGPFPAAQRALVQACTQLVRVTLRHAEHEAHIEQLAYQDGLTGLPNRAAFVRRAEGLIARGGPGALLLMDLDHFKAVNDLQGHGAGNAVLRAAADCLARGLQGVAGADTLSRLGDDEFVVWLPGAGRAEASALGERLCALLSQPLATPRGATVRLGLSVGLSLFPADGAMLDTLLKHADLALSEAKAAGRGCTRGFSKAMAQALEERAWVEQELRRALDQGELLLHFQPKLAVADQRLMGAEVLLRWPCPGRGWVPPDRFIPLAEACGLIVQLDAWVLEQACAQLAAWRDAGLAVPHLAVNQSVARFQQADVAGELAALLKRHALPGRALTVEVTERLMLDAQEDGGAVAQLARLRQLGVGVAIDDFGTGYSSLGYLRRLPISELKIDRSFIEQLADDAGDQALVRALVSMAQALQLNVVAEGVETPTQLRLLRELGCQAAQGFGLGRPMAAEDFANWVRAQAGR